MLTGRYEHALAAAPNGKLYAIGGYGGPAVLHANGHYVSTSSPLLASVEEYDPAMNTWTPRAPMPSPKGDLAVATGANGKIYAMGGYTSPTWASTASVFEYDPTLDTWATVTSMPGVLRGGRAAESGGRIYVVRGTNFAGDVYDYDVPADSWSTVASIPTPRLILGVAATGNGRNYAVGGQNAQSILSTVEEYDPASNSWSAVASMPTARSRLSVASASGKLYAIGGTADMATAVSLGTMEEATIGPPNADGDGVSDVADLCPGTAAGAAVDADGCAASQLDDDNDGVTNDLDNRPGTPAGEAVDVSGCSVSPPDSPAEAIADLTDFVGTLNLPKGVQQTLTSKLAAAFAAMERGQEKAAVNSLNAFMNYVNAQTGKKLSGADAQALLALAEEIIALIEA